MSGVILLVSLFISLANFAGEAQLLQREALPILRQTTETLGGEVRQCGPVNASLPWQMPPPKGGCLNMDLLFLKGPKTGSSSMGGIMRRIAARNQLNCVRCLRQASVEAQGPRVYADHSTAGDEYVSFAETSKHPIFVLGMVREPVARCLSAFYDKQATRIGTKPSPEAIIEYAESACSDRLWGYYSKAPHIDMLAITERFQESLVALAYLLNLSIGELLFIKSKDSSQRNQNKLNYFGNFGVKAVPLRLQSPEVQEYFASNKFRTRNAGDQLLFDLAHEHLNATLARMGSDRADQLVKLLNYHLGNVKERCFRLNERWGRSYCLFRDNGCHFQCLDAYATERGLWAPLADYDVAHGKPTPQTSALSQLA